MRTAFESKDCGRLYRVLDLKSRWAAMSLVRDAKRIAGLINAHYPSERRVRALARVRDAAAAGNAGHWVRRFCVREKVMDEFKDLADKPRKIESGKNRGHVITSTGRKVVCLRDKYGDWGCDVLRARIAAQQARTSNLLKVTEENVRVYRKSAR